MAAHWQRKTFMRAVKICSLMGVLALQACSSAFDKSDREIHYTANDRAQQAQALARQQAHLPAYVKDERVARFTTRSVPLSVNSVLPPHIQNITVNYPGRHGLATIADVLARTLGVVVFMTPDALMDHRAFAPAGNAVVSQPTAGASGNTQLTGQAQTIDPMNLAVPAAMQAGGGRLGLTQDQLLNSFELNYSGPLAGLLDRIAMQAQLRWTYEDGRIVFRRVVTQSIPIRVIPGDLKSSGTLTLNAGGNSSNVTTNSGGDIWEALGRVIPLMLSASGQFQVDTRMGMVTVRDAVANIAEIDRYIQQMNQLYARQISIQVEVIQVDLSTESVSGIDWVDLSSSSAKIGPATVSSSGPGFLKIGTDPASLGLYSNSKAKQLVFKQLEKYGRVSTMYSTVVNTMHRQPVPLNVSNTRTYVRSITAGTVTGSTITGPTLTAADLNTGFTLSLMPVILESNRVLLETAIGISAMRDLATFTTGSGFGQALVQQPNVDTFTNVQRVGLDVGETLVMLGYEYEEARNTNTDLMRERFPVSKSSQGGKKSVVILLTPFINEQ